MEVFSVKKLIFITFFIVALSSFSLAQPFSASIPSYPKDKFTEGQEGTAWLYVKITELGLVDSIEILKSSNADLLDKAAKLHVNSWKYANRYKRCLSIEQDLFTILSFQNRLIKQLIPLLKNTSMVIISRALISPIS